MLVTEKKYLPKSLAERESFFEKEWTGLALLHNAKAPLQLRNQQYLTWPILSGCLPLVEGADWVAIGDAASSYDPIVARGIYKGLSDGIKASHKLLHFFGEEKAYRENQFTEEVRNDFTQYQKNRAYVYTLEQRWPEESFWRNRYVAFGKIYS